MTKLILTIIAILVISQASYSQETNNFATKSFLIIQSTKSYDIALKKAQLACNTIGYTLNLRSLYKNEEGGLSSSEVCGCGETHGYLPRGRFDDGNYISIEYSSAFESFTPDYYIVVVSSGTRKDLNSILPKIKKHYKNAYIKDEQIYVGCMH